MTPLANEIYKQLVRRVRTKSPSITYGELAELASKKVPTHRRSAKLYAALSEVTLACRAASIPCLPAIVWRAGAGHPSDGFFDLAYPRMRGKEARLVAWATEHERVIAHAARYPGVL